MIRKVTSVFLLLCLGFISHATLSVAQNETQRSFEVKYDIYKIYPSVSISRDQLTKVNSIGDINPTYPSSWVDEYVFVEFSAIQNGKITRAKNKGEVLSKAQLDLIQSADTDTEMEVLVHYIPDNELSKKQVREMDFKFELDPDSPAEFPGGKKALSAYLKENAFDKIPNDAHEIYNILAVEFSINEDGQVISAKLNESSNDETVNKILLDCICNMPLWKPAQYRDGLKVKQDYVFIIGDMTSCTINLFNIDRF